MNSNSPKNSNFIEIVNRVSKKIAPAWPLQNSVAVNPYMGLSNLTFHEAAKLLANLSDIETVMPYDFYINKIKSGEILLEDIQESLDREGHSSTQAKDFLAEITALNQREVSTTITEFRTYIEAANQKLNDDFEGFQIEKISSFASCFLNVTKAKEDENLFKAWKAESIIDRSYKIKGLHHFKNQIEQLPNNAEACITYVLNQFDFTESQTETYLHSLLLKTLGWSSYISGIDWQKQVYGSGSNLLNNFIALLLSWEYAIKSHLESKGFDCRLTIPTEQTIVHDLDNRLILQDALDISAKRILKTKFNNAKTSKPDATRPDAQAVFCIDVRSEIYRRNLEKVNPKIETIGFAGFFGFPISYQPLSYTQGRNQCPALIPSSYVVTETFESENTTQKASKKRKTKHQLNSVWKKFKSGPVSSFGFVSAFGLSYLPKLVTDSIGWTRPTADPASDGINKSVLRTRKINTSHISLAEKITLAANALNGMSLTKNFARMVLIVGHESKTVNNPHATGLDCGACGGHSGEINALTAATVLNETAVRNGLLKEHGISIPDDTLFVACTHITTTDEVKIVSELSISESHKPDLIKIKTQLNEAGALSRIERGKKFNEIGKDIHQNIFNRSKDWSQIRPEYGLAGCNTIVVAPRERTKNINLEGRSFLHSYDWKKDGGFKILEGILNAPVIVTSWINLQYYASTVDNKRMGAGNKTLHNVTGGLGVLEGSSGDLRIGLPWQSIHNGTDYIHQPQRLNVLIEAPIDAINVILEKHPNLKVLFDNQWLSLMALDGEGKIAFEYKKNLEWESTTNDNKEYETLQEEIYELFN